MKQHATEKNVGAPLPIRLTPPHGTQAAATVSIPPVRWATPAAPPGLPQRLEVVQPQRRAAPIPPVRIPHASGAAPPWMPGTAMQGTPGNAVPPVRLSRSTTAVQPHMSGAATPQRTPVQRPDPVPPARPGVAQPQRQAVPIPPVRMPGATGVVQPGPRTTGRASLSATQGVTGAAPGEQGRVPFLSPHLAHALGLARSARALPPSAPVVQAMKRRRSTRERKPVNRGESIGEEEFNRRLTQLEEMDTLAFQKKEQEQIAAYEKLAAGRKRKKVTEEDYQTIYYLKGQGTSFEWSKETAYKVDKTRIQEAYEDAQYNRLEQQFYYTPTSKGDQFFSFQQGFDYVFYALTPETFKYTREEKGSKRQTRTVKKKVGYRRAGNAGPDYAGAAATADAAAQWLVDNVEGYDTLRQARNRVGRDINRLAGGLQSRIEYPSEYLWGNAGLATFSFIIRADKGRVPKATPYIERVLEDGSTPFSERFAGDDPLYLGTGKGSGRGPKGLRDQMSKRNYDSDYSSSDDDSS